MSHRQIKLGNVTEAHEAYLTAIREDNEARSRVLTINDELQAARKVSERTFESLREAEIAWRHQEHLASGFCAALVSNGDIWHRHYDPCPKRAKPNARFCGIHLRTHANQTTN